MKAKNYSMKNSKPEILIGYDLDIWKYANERIRVTAPFISGSNRNTLIAGESGGGKTYFTKQFMSRICLMNETPEKIILCDYKREDGFRPFRETTNYYAYDKAVEGLERFHKILVNRQTGIDHSRKPVYMIFDEYLACLLALKMLDKKRFEKTMLMVTELLSIGRSMNLVTVIVTQTAMASIFPEGSRLNFSNIIICGKASSLYDILLPKECVKTIGSRKFETGEGVAYIHNELNFVKIPKIRDEKRMEDIIVEFLSK